MVDQKNYRRNSLQYRLERSRRYRSRGSNNQHDAASIGDTSNTSMENASTASEPKAADTSVFEEPKDAYATKSISDSASIRSQSSLLSSTSSDNYFSRRQRVMKFSTLSKQVPHSSTKDIVFLKEADSGIEKSSRQSTNAPKAAHLDPISTESRDVVSDSRSRRNYYPGMSPKHQVASPCESMVYQASAMEAGTEDSQSISSESPPSRLQGQTNECENDAATLNSLGSDMKAHRVVVAAPMSASSTGEVSPFKHSVTHEKTNAFNAKQNYRNGHGMSNFSSNLHDIAPSSSKVVPKYNAGLKSNASPAIPPEVHNQFSVKAYGSQNQPPIFTYTQQHDNSQQLHRHSFSGKTPPVVRGSSPHHRQLPARDSSTQPRASEGNMYRNLLKPVKKDKTEDGSTKRTAFGGVIETPKSANVSSLRASFDSHSNHPIMPMNSSDPRVRHSLPLKVGNTGIKNNTGRVGDKQLGQDKLAPSRHIISQRSAEPLALPTTRKVGENPFQTRSEQNNLPKARPASPSSPTHGGVAARYRLVTGRTVEDERNATSEVSDDAASISADSAPRRTHQYYQASWRLQTNDFVKENGNKAVVLPLESGKSLSPRQTVISSWNQKYLEQQESNGHSPPNITKPRSEQEEVLSQGHISSQTREKMKHFESENQVEDELYVSASDDSSEQGPRLTIVSARQQQSSMIKKEKEISADIKFSRRKLKEDSSWQRRPEHHQKSSIDNFNQEINGGKQIDKSRVDAPPRKPRLASWQSTYEQNDSNIEATALSDSDNIGCQDDQDRGIKNSPVQNMSKTFVDAKYTSDTSRQQKNQQSNAVAVGSQPFDEETEAVNNPEKIVVEDNKSFESEGASSDADIQIEDLSTIPLVMPPKSQKEKGPFSKPWAKDTKQSVVQSWQSRSSRAKVSMIQQNQEVGCNAEREEISDGNKLSTQDTRDSVSLKDSFLNIKDSRHIAASLSRNSDDFIEEKKSNDLSVDEDKILGDNNDEYLASTHAEVDSMNLGHDDSFPQTSKRLSYDEDSYISGGGSGKGDIASQQVLQSSSKTASGRSRDSNADLAQINSEEISVYVEDSNTLRTKEQKMSAQLNKLNLNVEVENDKDRQEHSVVGVNNKDIQSSDVPRPMSPEPLAGRKTPLLNPSPKDNAKYRIGYFGEESPAKQRAGKEEKPSSLDQTLKTLETKQPTKATKLAENTTHVYDIWAASSASQEEYNESIQFDETEKWLNRDPEINENSAEDASVASEINETPPDSKTFKNLPLLSEEPAVAGFDSNVSFVDTLTTWTPTRSYNISEKHDGGDKILIEKQKQKDVFDPFHDDENDESLKIDVSHGLFSPNPDPFMTEESFSPLEWSSPKQTTPDHHIGYLNSPDSRVEI